MSHGCSRVALVTQKSLHGTGIVCWCSQPGRPGPRGNPSLRPCSSKATESNGGGGGGGADGEAKGKEQAGLQERLRLLMRTGVSSAGARVQDGLQTSREKFLSGFYSLQMPASGPTKAGGGRSKKTAEETGGELDERLAEEGDAGPVSVDDRRAPARLVPSEEEESPGSAGREPSPPAAKASGPGSKYTQTDFWINIPSFQDRVSRLRAPFWRTSGPPSSEPSPPAGESRQHSRGEAETGSDSAEGRRAGRVWQADSLKPDSIEVTAKAAGEPRQPDPNPRPGESGQMGDSPYSAALQNAIGALSGLRAAATPAPAGRSPPPGREDPDDIGPKMSPILYMSVALLEEARAVPEGAAGPDSPVKETESEARIRRQRGTAKADKTAPKPRKPVISKASIDDRTRNLSIGIRNASSNSMKLLKLERLSAHLTQYPESREVAIKEMLIPALLKIRTTWDRVLMETVNETLALLGYAAPVKGRGLRILSIDGGGTRGVIAIEALRELERQTGKPVRELFDYVMGVSSGAVLGFLLAIDGASLEECEALYIELSQEVFKRNTLLGTGKLFLNHAFYDTEGWIRILKAHSIGDTPMISTARHTACPKVAAVATLMNVGYIKDFLFRNYNLPPGTQSQYLGSCKYDLWQAARASSAAPGYFEECKLDEYIFQDGGVLTNNPCALAIHECRLLWPDTPIQCVVSIGCGRYDPPDSRAEPEYSSLKKKLTNIMVSATDTESVHTALQDLLPDGTYFRLNPTLTEDFLLDENRPAKIGQMQREARRYLELNELKLMQASGVLGREKTLLHRAQDWLRLQQLLHRR